MEFYILRRDEEYKVKSVTKCDDPLFGDSSWSILLGPFADEWIAETGMRFAVWEHATKSFLAHKLTWTKYKRAQREFEDYLTQQIKDMQTK